MATSPNSDVVSLHRFLGQLIESGRAEIPLQMALDEFVIYRKTELATLEDLRISFEDIAAGRVSDWEDVYSRLQQSYPELRKSN